MDSIENCPPLSNTEISDFTVELGILEDDVEASTKEKKSRKDWGINKQINKIDTNRLSAKRRKSIIPPHPYFILLNNFKYLTLQRHKTVLLIKSNMWK